MSVEIIDWRTLYSNLKLKIKAVTLQWFPGHWDIEDNESADSLAKKKLKKKRIMHYTSESHPSLSGTTAL